MAYTPPPLDQVDFNLVIYTPPNLDQVNFELGEGEAEEFIPSIAFKKKHPE